MAQQISPVSVATADALPPPRPRTEFQVTERQRKKPVAPRIRQRIFKGKSFTEGDTEYVASSPYTLCCMR